MSEQLCYCTHWGEVHWPTRFSQSSAALRHPGLH
jgi:hypothetical protein